MDTREPHRIVNERDIPRNQRRYFLPLTPDEAAKLTFATVEERAVWLASIGDEKIRERMDRWTRRAYYVAAPRESVTMRPRMEERDVTTNRPAICGKCGTGDHLSILTTYPETRRLPGVDPVGTTVRVACSSAGCGHSVSSDSIHAALAKFEWKVEAPS